MHVVLVPVFIVLHESTLFKGYIIGKSESAVIEYILLAAPEHIAGFLKEFPVYGHISGIGKTAEEE